jgi:general stress protein 26
MSKTEFWDRVETVNAGMLDVVGGARWVPMSHYADRTTNTLWFITASGTQIVDAVTAGSHDAIYLLADNAKGLFAHVSGSLMVSVDRDMLEKIWNPVASTWFEGGIDDPELRLLSFAVTGGEVWVTPTSGVRFMFNIAKAKLTGDDPDMGDHFTL